ncbi:MAG TPA: GNAT family N-acetyltransferase [Casimicrobiaceae bacterium]|nr:GNAT family N-acetyltransferase [Casimicrobiaceae bacterium]
MHDMLVKLYELPRLQDAQDAVARHGVSIRRALGPEKNLLSDWTASHFPVFAAELEIACCRLPISCFVAVREQAILGFACYDTATRNFFGPEAVVEAERGRGVGRALLLAALHAQREQGYAYAIIGGVGPAAFYSRSVGAVPIAGSSPGAYAGLLRPPAATKG